MVHGNTTPAGFAYFDKGIWVGIIAIKTERVQIHSRLALTQQLRKCARVLTCFKEVVPVQSYLFVRGAGRRLDKRSKRLLAAVSLPS